jgi:hypothetical protein
MKANVKGIAVIITLIAAALGFSLIPSVTNTVSAQNYLAGITSAYPDNVALVGWGNIQSRHNVLSDYPVQRCLVKLPPTLLSSIPSGSTINTAKLRVYTKDYNTQYCSDTTKRTYGAHKITQDWSPSSLTWRNQPAFQASATATIQKAPKTDVNQWWEFDITADINSPYGWTLKDETEDAGGLTGWRYIIYIDNAEIYFEYTLPSYTLTVSVKDSDGSSVSGATVTSPFLATTDANGQASSSLTYGSYTVAISYLGRTYSQSVTLDSAKTVSFTIPKYTLNIKVVDSNNKPVQGAYITSPVTGQTDANGLFSTSLRTGTYTVTVQADSQQASTSVSLDKTTDVTLALALKYSLQLKIVDQVGNPLPATVKVDSQTLTADKTGIASISVSGTVNVVAQIMVKIRQFSTKETFSVYKAMTKTIVITRRFYWTFFINYTDGSFATGTLSLTSPKETLPVSVTNGLGEAYLLDGKYSVSFSASPVVSVTTLDVINDGELIATLNKVAATTESTSQNTILTDSPNSPVGSGALAYYLLPGFYIYGLLGVLAFGFIIAAVVAIRRKQK